MECRPTAACQTPPGGSLNSAPRPIAYRLHALASMMALDGVLLLTHPSTQDTIAARHAMKIARGVSDGKQGLEIQVQCRVSQGRQIH